MALELQQQKQTSLSLPNSVGRRGSVVQMNAKIAALRGETVREDTPSNPINSHASNPYNLENSKRKVEKKKTVRFMQKNGRCNIRQDVSEKRKRYMRDIFTTLVDMRWRSNLLFFIVTYIIAWSLFGFLWWIIAYLRGDVSVYYEDKMNNVTSNHTACVQNVYSYTTAFLFFIETETSVGYGGRAITEHCPEAVLLFVIQALLGSILDAFMVGCIFIKISQPKNRAETLVFSEHCVISPRDRKYCLMFRVGNLRNSLMVQCRIRAKYVKSRQTQEGEFIGLHQDDINVGFDTGADNLFLVTPLIIFHEINEKSPFYSMSYEDLKMEKFEIIVILEGMVESTGMTCQARTSYLSNEVMWGHRFMPVLFHARGYFRVDHSDFHSIYEVAMPQVSMKEYIHQQEHQKPTEDKKYKSVIPSKLGGHISVPNPALATSSNNLHQYILNRQQTNHINKSKLNSARRDNNFKINSSTKRALSDMNVASKTVATSNILHICNSEILTRKERNNCFDNRGDIQNINWSVGQTSKA